VAVLDGAIALPGGGVVRGRGLRHGTPPGPTPAFGLYLGSRRAARRHDPDLGWPHRWLVWPDFRLPRHPREAADAIVGTHHRIVALGEDVEVACGGGVGRTGTVLACLAVLDGLGADDAVVWVRAHHHRRAVETRGQRRWVQGFAAEHGSGGPDDG
jgi:protein-tyrosine phosphatase